MGNATAYIFQMPLLRRETTPEQTAHILVKEELRSLRASLDLTLGRHVSSGSELLKALQRQGSDELMQTGLTPLDRLLAGGVPRGRLTELHGYRSSGRFSVVVATLAATTSAGEAAALIDLGDHFDPQEAIASGVDLDRVLWVRPETIKDAVTAAELVIRSGFQLVIVELGIHPRGRRAPEAAWVRLARAAESRRTALLVSTPWPITATAAEAVVRTTSPRALWSGQGKAPRLLKGITLRLQLDKHRHLKPGRNEEMRVTTERHC